MTEPAAERPPVTIVVPAHNEATVLGRCLRAVLRDAEPAEFAVLVVSNGSTDGTVARARELATSLGHPIDVLDIAAASKIAALRAAETRVAASAPGVTRIYLDADVVLTTHAARLLAQALRGDEPRLAMARVDIDASASSWLVRQYYRAWTSTGYIDRQDAGSGVFALNSAGVARVGPLPDVINDDGYVARRFGRDEKIIVAATFQAYAARSAAALVRRRARIVNGNRQLDALLPLDSPALGSAGGSGQGGNLLAAVRGRRLPATSALVFIALTALARALAAWRRLTGSHALWSTDTTTRTDTTTPTDSATGRAQP